MPLTELFNVGDPVPRSWFTKLDNVEAMTFLHPCVVETTPARRLIRKAEPVISGIAMIFFDHVKGTDGSMNAQFDRETIIVAESSDAPQ